MVPVAVGAWAVALVAIYAPSTAPLLALALWTAGLFVVVAIAATDRRSRATGHGVEGRGRAIVILAVVLVASAAAASHVAWAQPGRAQAAQFVLDAGRAVVITATVTGKIEHRAGGEWEFDAVATRLATGAASEPVRLDVIVRVLPTDVDRPSRLDAGSGVVVSGTSRGARPGGRAVLEVYASRGVRVTESPGGLLAVAADLRRDLVASTVGLSEPGAGLIPGLAVGDTSVVAADLDVAMKESALSHLTAVSGANCAIVVGLAFAAVAAAGGSRRARVIAGVLALFGFVLLVTPEPSVVRAGAMAAIAMLGVLLGRVGAGMAVLSLAVALLLVCDPWLAGSLGFALSTVATASLLLLARPLAAGLARWMPRPLALGLSVPLAAQLACGPLLVIITPSVPLYGVIANLLAAPAAPVATVVGLAACLAGPVPWVQAGLTAITWVPSSWIAGTALTFSSLPGDTLPWLDGWPGVAALGVVSTAIVVVLALPRDAHGRPGSTRMLRMPLPGSAAIRVAAGALLATVVGVVVGAAALTSTAGRLTLPTQWSVIACDVGQGDAVLVRSVESIALIDTGPDPEPLERCLARVGITRIDLLVLTHFDLDHVGGIDAVAGKVSMTLHGPVGANGATAVLASLEQGGSRLVAARFGMHGTLGEAEWRVLWPPIQSRAFPPGNDVSIVMDIRGGGVPTSLYLGDLSAAPQRALAASGALEPPYDLVKVAHHGSADQDIELYEAISAGVALVTVGQGNTYGHPRAETLEALEGSGGRVARTDLEGLVALWRSGTEVLVWRERSGSVAGTG